MAVKIVSAGEQTKIRSDGQFSKLGLAIQPGPSVFSARVNGTPGTDKVVAITYDGGSPVSAAVLEGMTLLVGSSAGAGDKGQARIRTAHTGASTGTLSIGETSEIDFADNDYLTVIDEFAPWTRPVRTDTSVDPPVVYMDYGVAYSNQHDTFKPVPVFGSPAVAWLIGASVDVEFDAADSWVPNSTVNAWAWSSTGGTWDTPTAQQATLTITATGVYRVTLTVTSAAGGTATGYRYVFVYSEASPPITQFAPNSPPASDDNGWNFSVICWAEATQATIRDRALVVLFARDYYNGAEGSIGPLAGRENVIAWGWIAGESITWNAEQSAVTFDVRGPHYWLSQMTAYPAGQEFTNDTPAAWTQMQNNSVDKMLWHIAVWRSTLTLCTDCSVMGNNEFVVGESVPALSVWDQIVTVARWQLAVPRVDRYGRLWVQVDAQFVPSADRGGIVTSMAITKNDWRDSIEFARSIVNPVGMVDVSGIYFDGYTPLAYFARCKGNVFDRLGKPETVDRLVIADQDTATILAGLVWAQRNNEYPRTPVKLAQNNRFLDIAPRQYVTLSLAATDTPRGVSFTDKKFIPRRVSFPWDAASGLMTCEVELEAATTEAKAEVADFPAELPTGAVSVLPSPPTNSGGTDGGDWVYVLTASRLGRTRNFTADSPTWTDITGLLFGAVLYGMCLDPFDPRNTAYITSDLGVFKTTNLDAPNPTWRQVVTASAFATATSKTLDHVHNVRATVTLADLIVVLAITTDNYLYLGRTLNGGTTWTWRQVAATSASSEYGLWLSQHSSDKVWCAGADGVLYRSTNLTTTFTVGSLYTVTDGDAPIANIEAPYNDNATDQTIIIGLSGGFAYALGDVVASGTLDGTDTIGDELSVTPGQTYALDSTTGPWLYVGSDPYAQAYTIAIHDTAGAGYTNVCGKDNYPSTNPLTWQAEYIPTPPSDIGLEYAEIIDATPPEAVPVAGRMLFTPPPGMTSVWVKVGELGDFGDNGGTLGYVLREATITNGPLILKSTNGGSTFSDITPDEGGAVGFMGLTTATLNKNAITALAGAAANSLDLVETTNGGTSWTTRQSAIDTPVAIGGWPYNQNVLYYLDADCIRYSVDRGVTVQDKTGDWASVMGSAFANPRYIVPMWLVV